MQLHIDLEPHLALSPDAREHHRQWLLDDLDNESFHLILAEKKGEILGYCLAAIESQPPIFTIERYAHILDLAIRPHCRRQGIGTALFGEMKAWIRKQGVQHIRLQIIPSNPMSSSFWPDQGFREFNRTLYMNLDEI